MALTYVALQTVTVGSGGASDVEFTSIPQTYTDLIILFSARNAVGEAGGWANIQTRFNNDTNNNYTSILVSGRGSGVDNGTYTSNGLVFHYSCDPNATANTFSNGAIYISNYTSGNRKSILFDSVTENMGNEAIRALASGLWTGTSAITSIKCNILAGGNFVQHTRFTLYGITTTV